MKVGFLGFGEVASTLSKGLMENGVEVYTCVEGRSTRTRILAKKQWLKYHDPIKFLQKIRIYLYRQLFLQMLLKSQKWWEIILEGIYVDINNVSPNTVNYALGMIENGKTVDAAIIGSVSKGLNVKIIASGPFADDFAQLKSYGMNITVIGTENGQASGIKLLRSAYTKGVSALLFESIYHAYKLGIDREVLKYISETECPDFMESAVSRIISAAFHAERRSEEMEEVVEMLSEKRNLSWLRELQNFSKC